MWYSFELSREEKNVGLFGVKLDLFMKHWQWLNASGDTALYCDSNRKDGGVALYISSESKDHAEAFSRMLSAKPCNAPDLSAARPLIKR